MEFNFCIKTILKTNFQTQIYANQKEPDKSQGQCAYINRMLHKFGSLFKGAHRSFQIYNHVRESAGWLCLPFIANFSAADPLVSQKVIRLQEFVMDF